MQPCSAPTPAASVGAAGVVVVVDGTVAGVGVVVVVVGGSVVVVVGGTVVVVVVGIVGVSAFSGTLVGTVVVVVVVVVGGTVACRGRRDRGGGRRGRRGRGRVVLVVAVASVPLDGGGVMVTVAQAPACSRVPTDAMSCVRSLFSAAWSDVNATAACARALEAASRRCSALLKTPSAAPSCETKWLAATPRYCCTTTPSESSGVLGERDCVPPLLTSGAPEYKPLLTYSLTANCL